MELEGRFIRPSNSLLVSKSLRDQVRHAADNRLGCEFALGGEFSEGGIMKVKISVILALVLLAGLPLSAGGKKKKSERAMLEKMEAVPCGAKEKGVTGLGTVWASAGITHVNSDEKLCPQYMVVSDEMEYHIRPTDKKHPIILPVGHEIEFEIKKDRMFLKVADGDEKMRTYQVVAMKPTTNSDTNAQNSSGKSERP
jgi:hypothetical protein